MWPSCFGLDSFRRLVGRLLFQSSLRKVSAPSVGRCHLVLSALFRVDPSLVGCCCRSILGRFGWSFVGKNPFWDKNPFFAAFLQENPMLWEKPVFLVIIEVGRHFSLFSLYRSSGDFFVGKTRSGKTRGRAPLLIVHSLPIFGRFLSRKNPLGKKPFSCWENSLGSLSIL